MEEIDRPSELPKRVEITQQKGRELVFAATQHVLNAIFNGNGKVNIGGEVYHYFLGKILKVEDAVPGPFQLVRDCIKGVVEKKETLPEAVIIA